jgi:hypothetical protein
MISFNLLLDQTELHRVDKSPEPSKAVSNEESSKAVSNEEPSKAVSNEESSKAVENENAAIRTDLARAGIVVFLFLSFFLSCSFFVVCFLCSYLMNRSSLPLFYSGKTRG